MRLEPGNKEKYPLRIGVKETGRKVVYGRALRDLGRVLNSVM